ncbi:hypothetical protein P152DRAFT_120517 [Eremomyces bilateralis CBS 781.70]|uniref:DUF6590 domain-containing protein n=1 Tax=Eremomyces bilateralis CBS 781.70 TaxID=1392243 RepID=A0A6G1GEL6_9PEZI|nr:uncharacterized protein P152DRAFT_120517 [Eremomyces bilateralis CBS 781.70]KAF1816356.1 hypothetical protein P152DRAFT_120517 [Eremomyces bilateralis CBS 781.70]
MFKGAESFSQASRKPHPVKLNIESPNPLYKDHSRLFEKGIRPYKVLRGSKGNFERFHSKFIVRKRKFYKLGKVFQVLWPEPQGSVVATEKSSGTTKIASEDPANFEGHYAKVRWFVVILEGSSFSSCLPIQTYEGRGVSKPSVNKSHHCIAFTSQKAPEEHPSEAPSAWDTGGMRKPIRIITRSKTESLVIMSRLNYAKVYTVEHNVKSYDFGNVAEGYLHRLSASFKAVSGEMREATLGSRTLEPRDSDVEEEDEEEDDEDEDEDEDEEEEDEDDEDEDKDEEDEGEEESFSHARGGVSYTSA